MMRILVKEKKLDYKLHLIGSIRNSQDEEIEKEIRTLIKLYELEDHVYLSINQPFDMIKL